MLPSVLFIGEKGDSPSTYYRCHIPANGLRKRGYKVYVDNAVNWHSDSRGYRMIGDGIRNKPTDVVVLRKCGDPFNNALDADLVEEIKGAQKAGQKIFYDIDDDRWNVPVANPAFSIHNHQNLRTLEMMLSAVNGVLCSTGNLAMSIEEHSRNHARIYICQNGVNPAEYPPHRTHEPVRIGWLGLTNYRAADFYDIYSAIKNVMEAGLDVEFYHLGHRDELPALQADFPIVTVPWVGISKLPMSLHDIDIAIVPMRDHPFNHARSNITGIACLAAGIPIVASPTAEYKKLAELSGGACILAGDKNQWEYSLRELITEPEWRRLLSAKGRECIRQYYASEQVALDWMRPIGTKEKVDA